MRKMKLAAKISVGFGLLIVIAMTLGSLAVYNMNDVAGESTKLATEYVPEVEIAVDIRGAANRLMYNMRGYGFTENEEFYKAAEKEVAVLDAGLKRAGELAQRAIHLKKLAPAVKRILDAEGNYSRAMAQTKALITEMNGYRNLLDQNAGKYMKNSSAFLEGQNKAFKYDLAERQKKIQIVTDLVKVGSKARITNFKAQATGAPALMQQAINTLGKVSEITTQLRKITRDEDDIKRIDGIVGAADGYRTAMTEFLVEFKQGVAADSGLLNQYRKAMDKNAGIYVTNCSDFLAGQQAKLTTDMNERHEKIAMTHDIINLANDTRVKAFKSQALRDPALMIVGQKNFAAMDEKFGALGKITRLKKDLQRIDDVKAAAKGYGAAMKSFLAGWKKLQALGEQRDSLGKEVIGACVAVADAGMTQTSQIANGAMNSLNHASLIMLLGLAAALVIGVILAVLITISITRPVNGVIIGLTEGAGQVAAASGQVSNSSQSLAEGASQQAASLEETSSSMEEMHSMTKKNAENAEQANSLMSETGQTVKKANSMMGELRTAMEKISATSNETAKIIKTIDEIAFQTNLLALNAAVEAARAGEAGAGFAVVADEVRSLAMRAAEAAKNTQGLIESNITDIKSGSNMVATTDEAFVEVAESTQKAAELVSEIAAASSEQAHGIDQVNRAVSEMDKVTQTNAANAEESASASEELSAQAVSMQGFVGELVELVGNANNGSGGAKGWGNKKRVIKTLPAPEPHMQTANAKNPREEIPLEDDPNFVNF